MMHAAIYKEFGGPIRIESVPRPLAPPNGVVIQVCATGVCRSDWHGWKGHDDDIRQHGLPFCPGHEVSGIVVEVGASVRRFRPGDKVGVPFILSCGDCRYCAAPKNRPTVCTRQEQPGFTQLGSFAEYLALPRADRNLCHLPEGVSFVQAAALGCRFTTAHRAVLQQGRLQQGDCVAIFGCGGLGLSCIMLAAARGAFPIVAIDISPAALEKAQTLGATHTVLDTGDSKQVRAHVKDITQGGANLSVDAAGFPAASENAVWSTAPTGRMVQVGLPGDSQPNIPMGLVAGKELELIGSHGFAAQDLPDLLAMVASGQLDPAKLVERHVTLEEGARAIDDMDHSSPLGITMITQFPRHEKTSRL